MSGRLDSNGVLHDMGWQRPQLALDAATRGAAALPTPSTDEALKALRARDSVPQSPMARLISGYNRLR